MAPLAPPLAHSLTGLAALLPEAGQRCTHSAILAACTRLSDKEVAAIQAFEATGRQCLEQLTEGTLAALRATCIADPTAEATRENFPQPPYVPRIGGGKQLDGSGQSGVRQMFEHFDGTGRGRLTRYEFKDMLVSLGLEEHLTGAELASLVGAADSNGDGFVDLGEFTEWLYTGSDLISAKLAAPESEDSGSDEERGRVEQNLRRQLCQTRLSLEEAETKFSEASRSHAVALRRAEERYEDELDNMLQFLRAAAESSASQQLGRVVELDSSTLLGNGKYGYVLKSKRRACGTIVVVKLLSLRWAHIAAKEWAQARAASEHPNIVEYTDILLHADEDKMIHGLLQEAQQSGKLQSRVRRESFPKFYMCLMQEFMNRGSVQDWMDHDMLMPGGLLVVMQRIASALSHMHLRLLTHNDIKPENILLSQGDGLDERSEVTVKLADLGLAAKSTNRFDDFWQFGMTALCMTTGERFGERKFQRSSVGEYVAAVASCVSECGTEGEHKVFASLATLPELLRKVWKQEVTMREVSDEKNLQGWNFFDGAPVIAKEVSPTPGRSPVSQRHVSKERMVEVKRCSTRRPTKSLGGDEEVEE